MAIINYLHKYAARKKAQIAIHRSRFGLDNHLQIRGKWLRAAEVSNLASGISNQIVEFLDTHETKRAKLDEVYDFQGLLILYSFLQLGGQRREVVASFMVGVSDCQYLNKLRLNYKLELCNDRQHCRSHDPR